MSDDTTHHARPGFGYVRTLSQQEELPLLRDHLLRLDTQSRRDRFHGFMDDDFIERYAAKCADDGTIIIAYMENGIVRGAAELHPPGQSDDGVPEIAFSVETCVRRQGVGSILFKRLLSEARWKGYRRLRVTTGRQMRRCGRLPASLARISCSAMASRPGRSKSARRRRPNLQGSRSTRRWAQRAR